MRRPLVIGNVLSFLVILLINMSNVFYYLTIILIIFLVIKKEYKIIIILTCIISSFIFYSLAIENYESSSKVQSHIGFVSHLNGSDDYIFENKNKIKILIKNDLNIKFTEKMFIKKKYKITYKRNIFYKRNPNTFNYKNYLYSKGYFDVVLLSELKYDEISSLKKLNIKYFNYLVSNKIKTIIQNSFENIQIIKVSKENRSISIVTALLLGDKTLLDEDLLNTFRNNGTSHVLSISGLHIGLLYGLLYKLLFFLKDSKRKLISILILFMYILMIGIPISALRSGAMLLFALIAFSCNRKYDMLNVLSLISLILIFVNPYIVYNTSYILSFLAILIISTLYRFINSEFKTNIILKILLLPVVIQIGMIPIQLYLFNKISILSFLINIPTIFVITIVLYLSVLLVLIFFISPYLSTLIGTIISLMLEIIINLNKLYESINFLHFEYKSPRVILVIAFYLLLISLVYKNRKKIILIVIPTLVLLNLVYSLVAVEVYFIDIGQGDCILIKEGLNNHVLIDGGLPTEGKILKDILYKNGVDRLKAVILSHSHNDHIGGLIDISESINSEYFFYEEKNRYEDLFIKLVSNYTNTKIKILKKENDFNIGKLYFSTHGVSIGENINNSSLVMTCKIYNTSILFTGDIEKEAEEVIVSEKDIYNIDILKVPHHGSLTSSTNEFLKLVNPKIAITCVGRNNYGHPSRIIINKYKNLDIDFYRTDRGCVKIIILPFNIYFVKQYF